jgi:hypothetical protein
MTGNNQFVLEAITAQYMGSCLLHKLATKYISNTYFMLYLADTKFCHTALQQR